MTRDGRRFLVHAAFVAALLGVVASAAANWLLSGLAFFGEQPTDDDYRSMALGFAVGAVLLLLALLPAYALRLSPVVAVLAVVLAVACGAASTTFLDDMARAEPAEYPEPWGALAAMAWLPTSWPLFLFLLAAAWLVTKRCRTGHSALSR